MTTTLESSSLLERAPRIFRQLGMPEADNHPYGYDLSRPKRIDFNTNDHVSISVLADSALKSFKYLYLDTPLKSELRRHYHTDRMQKVVTNRIIPELGKRSLENGASQLVTQWYVPSSERVGPAKFAMIDDGPGYANIKALRDDYLKDSDYYYTTRGVREFSQQDGTTSISWPTSAVNALTSMGGSMTIATSNARLSISQSNTMGRQIQENVTFTNLREAIGGTAIIINLPSVYNQ